MKDTEDTQQQKRQAKKGKIQSIETWRGKKQQLETEDEPELGSALNYYFL